MRVGVLAGALNSPLGIAALRFLVPLLAAGVLACVAMFRRGIPTSADLRLPGNPLRLAVAVQMALFFQAVLYLVSWAAGRFGAGGVFVSAGLFGLTDMDARTYSMVKLSRQQVALDTAARALAVGVLANTLLKLALALALGRRLLPGGGRVRPGRACAGLRHRAGDRLTSGDGWPGGGRVIAAERYVWRPAAPVSSLRLSPNFFIR